MKQHITRRGTRESLSLGALFLLMLMLALAHPVRAQETQSPSPSESSESESEAEEDDEDYLLMGEDAGLTVEGRRPADTPAAPETSPYGQKNTVTKEQIHDQGSRDLLDALRNVPGVSFSKRNLIGGDTGTSLYIRGRGASHPSVETITNFDGVPRNGAIYGQSMPDAFSLDIAERVDVYKSPQITAFGVGYALVDMIPRRMKTEGWEVEAGLSLGSYLTFAENLSFGFKKKAFDIFAAQSWTSTEGHEEHAKAYRQSYYLNTGWTFTPNWDIRLLGNFVNARSERPRKEGQDAAEILPSFRTDSGIATLTVNNTFDKAKGYGKAYLSRTAFYWEDENPSLDGDYSIQDITVVGFRMKESLWLWPNGEIIAGMDIDWTRTRNLDHNEAWPSVLSEFPDMFLFSPYLAASHYFGKPDWFHITPQAGIRAYVHTVWANTAAPQFGVVAGYKNTDLYANYVLGYVYPAPANIQSLVNAGGASDARLKEVDPEIVYHHEIGVTHRFDYDAVQATIGGSFFYDDGRNRIIAVSSVPENASLVSYFRITGVEVYGTVTPLEDLNLFAGGSWMTVRARGEDGVEVDKMPFTPDLSASVGFSWRLSCFKVQYLENVTVSGDYRYLGGVYAATALQFSAGFINSDETSRLDDQHLVRLRLAYEMSYRKWRIHKAEAYINMDNLLNQTYEYWPGYRLPGITVMAGLTVTLN
ncbi:MAG: TonB-dependent receptor plug domain-containing protein [Spirochaetaceae bacterium]|nr:TonB-dependent receptor plug domain-containing protein [Spirochaetaceae bacterium]